MTPLTRTCTIPGCQLEDGHDYPDDSEAMRAGLDAAAFAGLAGGGPDEMLRAAIHAALAVTVTKP